VLTKLQLPDPGQILTDHAVCYPPADPGDQMVLEPLYPDRLAEDFLALTVPGHAADYPAQDWAVPTSAALLARDGDASTPATWTARAVTFLASAAHRWSHLGPGQLYPLLRDDPQLAVDAGSAALIAVAGISGVPVPVLEAIEGRAAAGTARRPGSWHRGYRAAPRRAPAGEPRRSRGPGPGPHPASVPPVQRRPVPAGRHGYRRSRNYPAPARRGESSRTRTRSCRGGEQPLGPAL
jgi:hypothetical protein